MAFVLRLGSFKVRCKQLCYVTGWWCHAGCNHQRQCFTFSRAGAFEESGRGYQGVMRACVCLLMMHHLKEVVSWLGKGRNSLQLICPVSAGLLWAAERRSCAEELCTDL